MRRVWILLFVALALASFVSAETCAVYFTGNGCPHCAKAKPAIEDVLSRNPDLVIIEYEIYEKQANGPLLQVYSEAYGFDLGIPTLVFGKGDFLQGDEPILSRINSELRSHSGNPCPLVSGESMDFSLLNVSTLVGQPSILKGSGSVDVDGESVSSELSIYKVVMLALADAVNPCVYAMVVLILVAIITRDPKNRKKMLLAGLYFSLAVFLLYFIYGTVIIAFFRSVQVVFATLKPFLYNGVAALAVILGLINIRDYFSYSPGRVGSEMPIMFRPKVKKIIAKVTSPAGAFWAGTFVTLFLLPCTAGPYVILGGILSSVEFAAALPWLLFYNFIFVLPILILTLVVYLGFSSVEQAAGWRESNIRYMHLVEGLLMLLVGLGMLFGLI